MKTTPLFLCFILFSIYTTSLLICAAAQESAPVVDTDGNQLQAGVDYYILPALLGDGGGLTLDSIGNKACPLDVVQAPSDLDKGLPLYFRPVNPEEGVVRVSTDQNIIFNASTLCVQSTVWSLYYDESLQKFFITTGGAAGNPGLETLSNWFKIEEYYEIIPIIGLWYKLVFCPTVCDYCKPVCGDIGIFVQDGQRRLTLIRDDTPPLLVVFQKVEVDGGSSIA